MSATSQRHVLLLELEFDGADDVSGRLTDQIGHGRDFVGWLGLAGAIEALAVPADLLPADPVSAPAVSTLAVSTPRVPGSTR